MQNKNFLIEREYKTMLDYFNIIKSKLVWVTAIFLIVSLISVIYAITRVDIYKAEATLKISQPNKNILESPLETELGGGSQADRFIANEIETMKNISLRKKVSQVIIDTFKARNKTESFSLILNKKFFSSKQPELKQDRSISDVLNNIVNIEQKKGLDFITLTSSSPSPYEAALFVNAYADVYREFNLADTRKQVTRIKEYLKTQKEDKHQELVAAENNFKMSQLKDGTIQLDEQARSLITTITDLETKINETAVNRTIAKATLDNLKNELSKKDATLAKYLESKAAEPYIVNMQKQIAELEAQRDFAQLSSSKTDQKQKLTEDFEFKIKSLKDKLNRNTDDYQSSLLTSSPEEIKLLTQEIFEEEVKYNSLNASYRELNEYLKQYESRFDQLPGASIDLARMERERISSEKLYLLLEEKYQEALINEQSTEGNVLILNYADIPDAPAEPNRMRIILIGLVLGLVLGIGFAIVSDQMDKSVKTPEDIENREMELLGWIPEITEFNEEPFKELIVMKKNDNVSTDSFKSIRTILRYSKVDKNSKTILVTSSAPSEGKSLVSVNLAGSYALSRNKTVILDCDLRKPRIHNIFNEQRVPGFTDYLVGKNQFEEIIRRTPINDLFFISAGTIPPNPTEILDSRGMVSFLSRLSKDFDTIIIDSPPLTTLADSLILSNLVDETILVARAYSTEIELLKKSVATLKKLEKPTFSGVLLNGFNLTKNYGSYYYKYSYSYNQNNSNSNGKAKKKKIEEEVI